PFGHEGHAVTLPASGQPSVFVRQGHHVADALAQLLAGLEMRYVLSRKGHGGPGLRVAAGTRRPVVERKAAETADFNPLTLGQRSAHDLQPRLHRQVAVVRLQVGLAAGQDLDQFRLGHGPLAPPSIAAGGPGARAARRAGLTPTCLPAARAAARPAWWCRWKPRRRPCCTRPGWRRSRLRPWP